MPRRAEEVFGERASFYVSSPAHADPSELERIVGLASPRGDERALDVATGTGHTALAFAPRVRCVVGVDLTPEMLSLARRAAKERGAHNVSFGRADVERLPFPNGCFDLVTCRRAAHHFLNVVAALEEIGRVLRPGGLFVLEDRSVPEDDFVDRTMNRLDVLHDPSHVREYRLSEWNEMLSRSAFRVRSTAFFAAHRPLDSLTDRADPEDARQVLAVVDSLDTEQRRRMGVEGHDGVTYIDHYFVIVAAERRAEGVERV